MRKPTWLIFPLIIIFLISCGERKNAVISEEGYQIVTSLPPIGVFRHLYIDTTDGIGYLSADYAGLVTMDISNPESPVILDTLQNELYMTGGAGSSYYSHITDYIYVEVYPAPSGGQIKAFLRDSIETAMGPVLVGASPPVEKFEVREFPRDSAGITIVDSINIYIADLNEITAKFYKQMYRRTGEDSWVNIGSANYSAHSVYDFEMNTGWW